MYNATTPHASLAAAGGAATLPFTGLSLMWILIVAIALLVVASVASLKLRSGRSTK